ncbi:galactose ABC transporter substrate-binding protein [Enterococcus timonensis]|uniref:galactose ABC transporter substrate-binding protein n=1 Tax=Enterococcus timonensis TaxID=1852364 RepID=UPI0008D968E0|nr:galactose ABC transporter substrate-binding protein [Enterococcus timonensis]
MKLKLFLPITFLLIPALFLVSCGKSEVQEQSKIHIGLASYNQEDIFMNELITSFEGQMEEFGEKEELTTLVTTRDSAHSQRRQDIQVKELLDAGCSVLVVNLVDRTAPSKIIELAREKDVPVIFFNREPVMEDLNQWDSLYYVGGDAKESGQMQGEIAAEAILNQPQIDHNQDGKIQYVVLEGETGHQDAIIRTEEAVNALKEQGIVLEKLGYEVANWNRAQAANRMTQLINQHQNDIELVLANNDEMALGGLDAYHKLNRTQASIPIFFGIDGTKEGLEAIKDGQLAGTVYNNKEEQAEAMAEIATALATNKRIPNIYLANDRKFYASNSKITQENVGDYE